MILLESQPTIRRRRCNWLRGKNRGEEGGEVTCDAGIASLTGSLGERFPGRGCGLPVVLRDRGGEAAVGELASRLVHKRCEAAEAAAVKHGLAGRAQPRPVFPPARVHVCGLEALVIARLCT